MTTKHLSHDELHVLLKKQGFAESHPGLAMLILSGQTVFETGGVSYALRSSRAANLTREAPAAMSRSATSELLTGDEADKRIDEFERARLARGSQPQPERPRASPTTTPVTERADASEELLTLVRNTAARDERAEHTQEREDDPLAQLFGGDAA